MQIGIDIAAKRAKRAKRKKHGSVTVAPYEKAGSTYYSVECRRKEVSEDDTETAELLRKHGGKTGEELKSEGK